MSNIWLAHHGILGQKWGVRRFQNKDGSLTAAGRKRQNAINYAKEMANYDKNTADDFKNTLARYSKDNKNRTQEYLKDYYDDPELIELIKYEAQDQGKSLDDYLQSEIDYSYDILTYEYKDYINNAQKWEKKAEKMLSATSLDEFSKEELKEMEKMSKKYIKELNARKKRRNKS